MGMKFGGIVVQVHMHQLTESDFYRAMLAQSAVMRQ